MRALRRGKAEAALLIALADIGGVWPVERVTRALTELADAALRAAVRYLLRGAAAQGKFSPCDPARPEEGSGYVILPWARWRIRAQLLERYRSDRALRRERVRARGRVEPAQFYVRLTRALVKLMQERTADGYGSARICACGPIRLRPRSQSRSRPRSTIMRAPGRTGSAPP